MRNRQSNYYSCTVGEASNTRKLSVNMGVVSEDSTTKDRQRQTSKNCGAAQRPNLSLRLEPTVEFNWLIVTQIAGACFADVEKVHIGGSLVLEIIILCSPHPMRLACCCLVCTETVGFGQCQEFQTHPVSINITLLSVRLLVKHLSDHLTARLHIYIGYLWSICTSSTLPGKSGNPARAQVSWATILGGKAYLGEYVYIYTRGIRTLTNRIFTRHVRIFNPESIATICLQNLFL